MNLAPSPCRLGVEGDLGELFSEWVLVQEFADDLLLRAEKIGAQLRERLGETS